MTLDTPQNSTNVFDPRRFHLPILPTFNVRQFPCFFKIKLPYTNSRSKPGPKKWLLPRPVCYQHFCEKIVEATGGPIDFAAAWVAGDKADAVDAVESEKGGAVEELKWRLLEGFVLS